MSRILMAEQASAPPTPSAGYTRVYINSGGTLSSVDDAGVVTTYGDGITQEQVEDYVGNLLQDSSTINVTYNDAGNICTFDVIAGGVNHNALLNYVANEHINHSSVSITAGTGLTGGGDLTTSRTLSIANTGVTAGTYQAVTVNAQGQVTGGSNPTTLSGYGITDAQPLDGDLTAVANLASTGLVTRTASNTMATRTITAGTGISVSNGDGVSGNPTISTTITQYTDEQAQDAVGGILTDTASVDFTYNDAGNTISAVVLPAGVNHNALQNYVANEHVNHSSVSITAGTGLSGGGDITTSRTLNIANTGVTAASYGSTTAIPVITVNAQGQITAASTASVTSSQWSDAGGFLTWSDESGKDLVVRQANSGGEAPFIRQVKSSGTLASPTAVSSGDKLGGNGYYGWNAAGQDANPSVEFSGYASENHTPSAQGGEMRIYTIQNGTTTAVLQATLQNDGNWNIQSNRITNAQDPVNPQDYATKAYVDNGGSWQELVNTSTFTNNSGITVSEVPNLKIDVVSGRNYQIEANLRFRSAAVGTGIGLTMNSSDGATGTIAGSVNIPQAIDSTTSIYSGAITSLGDLVLSTSVPAANIDYLAVIVAQFTCTGSGTIAPFFRSETNGTTVTIQIGSNIIAREWA